MKTKKLSKIKDRLIRDSVAVGVLIFIAVVSWLLLEFDIWEDVVGSNIFTFTVMAIILVLLCIAYIREEAARDSD
ncbi:MAG: hypothetical protein LBQ52_04900 [Helicobacteraceae bacterium]|jgi:hypothetical protein|nr:hypothetical protein [Helicobacteraceae bacterium]